eukprot:1651758-Prymnesium_polylepis.2
MTRSRTQLTMWSISRRRGGTRSRSTLVSARPGVTACRAAAVLSTCSIADKCPRALRPDYPSKYVPESLMEAYRNALGLTR